jgi:hypothetical protein
MLIQPARLFDAATSTHAPTPGHHSSHPQTKGKGDRIQTSRVQDQPFPHTTTYQENGWYQNDTNDEGREFEGAADQPGNWEGTDERELIYESLDVEEYEYADGEPEGGEDDDQVFSCLQEEETGNGLGGEVEYEYGEEYFQDGNEEGGEEVEYAVSELVQPVGDDEGEPEPYYSQDGGDDDDDDSDRGEDGTDDYEDDDD